MGAQPFRPPNEKDLVQMMNGRARFLGVIRSTGTAVDNSTTAAPAPPFSAIPASTSGIAGVDTPQNLSGTLAGKMLLLQPSAAGFVRASSGVLGSGVPTVATFTLPVGVGFEAGVKLQTEERVTTTMLATDGWLQWISVSGTADLFVWELT